jgi:hypothetical protein
MRSIAAVVLFVILVSALPAGAANAEAPARQYDTLWQQSTPLALGKWSRVGVAVAGSPAVLRLAPEGKSFPCWRADIDGGVARYDVRSALCAGTDPGQPHARSSPDYNGSSFLYGVTRSPVHRVGQPINHVIVSWDATTPAGTWLEVHIRVQEGARWTHWYDLPVWASGTSSIHRHSINGQQDRWGSVATDTFSTGPDETASAYQLAVTLFTVRPGLSPALRAVDAIASFDGTQSAASSPDRAAWGIDLSVPSRSQMLPAYRGLGDGGGGEAWCSPTSTDMILAYWGETVHRPDLNLAVPTVAAGTYDTAYDGAGNWPFNTAYAAEHGLTAYVTRFYSLSQVERWVQAHVPIAISIAFAPGELPGAPISSTSGHLLVVRGFTRSGDPIVNDPAAANDAAVRIVYPRAALERAWQRGSHGTAYVIYPAGWHVP